MKLTHSTFLALALAASSVSCGKSNTTLQPIFIQGRAVEISGDTVVAMTRSGFSGILLRNNRTEIIDTLAYQSVSSPVHLQLLENGWLVSESREGAWWISGLNLEGDRVDSIGFENERPTPHQFAGLPDGRIVLEVPGGVLLSILEGVVDTFVVTDENAGRSGILVALAGGVMHAVPDQHITLYNEFGNPRWRLEWPWRETAVFTDIAVDANGRPHMMAGIARDEHFVVYSLDVVTGEVIRWSEPGPDATFVVERLGLITPDDPVNWAGE
jgi:hypothetical protein